MAQVVNLSAIKTRIKEILDLNNTTTASPIDLSSGLTDSRVQKVLKIHPEMIPFQASFFPLVTCYIDDKSPNGQDIARDQLSARRRASLKINICGAVYNSTYVDDTSDPADEDINHLMENIELILRTDPDLDGTVCWQKANSCKYYATALNSQSLLRVGVLELEAEVMY